MDFVRRLLCIAIPIPMVFVSLILCVVGYGASAHSPFLTNKEHIVIEGKEFTLALLNGDGILFANPIRAVLIDQEGYAWAVSEQSEALSLLCRGASNDRKCIVYDELEWITLEIDPASLAAGVRILEGDTVLVYPEFLDAVWGFNDSRQSLLSAVALEVRLIASNLAVTMVATAWWFLGLFPVAGLASRLRANGWRPWPIRVVPVALTVLAAVYFCSFLLVTAYLWLLEPYSTIFAFMVGSLGLLLAFLATGLVTRKSGPRRLSP